MVKKSNQLGKQTKLETILFLITPLKRKKLIAMNEINNSLNFLGSYMWTTRLFPPSHWCCCINERFHTFNVRVFSTILFMHIQCVHA